MLDLQLAMYLPFLKMMEPGVFIACADDIEVMVLGLRYCTLPKGLGYFSLIVVPKQKLLRIT